MNGLTLHRRVALFLAGGLLAFAATAQEYPQKPVRLIVAYPPGGSIDILARTIVPKLSAELGQPGIIDNKAGGGGAVGADIVAHAAADGYTLGLAVPSMLTLPIVLGRKLSYEPAKDFTLVSIVAKNLLALVVTPNFPARSLKELDSLAQSLEHVKTIIAMQQNYAKVTSIHEAMSVVDVVEDALRLNAISFTRHEIRVRREFLDRPTATLERHKIMQILVNLLTNAKHALDKPEVKDKTLTVRVALNGHKFIRISVVDTGSGITPESMARLFQHGFTTKPQGHGFGLHHGSLAAKEMGGSLTAHSDGEGKGATFTLEIPTLPPEARE